MNRSFLEVLEPQSFADQFNAVRKLDELKQVPDLPIRPDYADVIDHDNNAIEEINDSVLDAEISGGLPCMAYPLPLAKPGEY